MEMLINGQLQESGTGKRFEVINPATGATVDTAPAGSAEDVRKAADAAEDAFPKWSAMSAKDRGRIMLKASQIVRERAKDMAPLLTMEQGKPLAEATTEMQSFANTFEYYAHMAANLRPGVLSLSGSRNGMVIRKPIGVCGAILPWNFPVVLMSWKIGPALAAGNTVVLKPASTAPLSVMRMAAVMKEAGLPDGVLNVVTGSGSVVGEEIARNPKIRKVSFTGETGTGRHVMELASASLKRITMELGGSDPMIVCDDADLKAAVEGAAHGRFMNCGQLCFAVKRLFVFESVADEFVRMLKARVSTIKVGNGLEPGVTMGPLNNRAQRDRIAAAVNTVRAKNEGKIILGGEAPKGPAFDKGFFYMPTLVTDVAKDSVLLREEMFGPVLPIVTVKDLDEAIERANDTPYGLGSTIWTKSIQRANIACERLQAGMTCVNQPVYMMPVEMPKGGVKASGFGRECGTEGIDEYTEIKSVMMSP